MFFAPDFFSAGRAQNKKEKLHMSLIRISNLNFAYQGTYDNVFENLNADLDSSWKLGVIGRNGCGKTTLLNLLEKKLQPDGGSIVSSAEFCYFPFATDAEKLCWDAVSGVFSDLEIWRLQKELSLLRLNDEILFRPLKSLSQGEQTKLLLATIFARENNFLLIDEPTNHLDVTGKRIVADYLRKKQGFVLVSHDRDLLDSVTDHIMCIEKHGVTVEQGNYSVWKENNLRREQFELSQNEKLKKEINRLEIASRQNAAWANNAEKNKIGFDPSRTEKNIGRRAYEGAKSKKMMSAAKNLQKRKNRAAEEKSALLKDYEEKESLKLRPQKFYCDRLALFDKVCLNFGEKSVLKDLSFEIFSGERVALAGKNGCGKTSAIKLLTGDLRPTGGKVEVSDRLKISFVPQNAEVCGNLKEFASQNRLDESLFKAILRKTGFTREQFDKDMSDFSSGQKKKVMLAKSLCEEAHLYVWDEPLNYIDVISREQIEELILQFKPTLLFVEHDSRFCRNIATKIVELH